MRVRLAKARSYMGHGVNVDRRNPEVEVSDEVGERLIATGYFYSVKEEGPAAEAWSKEGRGDKAQDPEKKPGRKQGSAKGDDVVPGFEG